MCGGRYGGRPVPGELMALVADERLVSEPLGEIAGERERPATVELIGSIAVGWGGGGLRWMARRRTATMERSARKGIRLTLVGLLSAFRMKRSSDGHTNAPPENRVAATTGGASAPGPTPPPRAWYGAAPRDAGKSRWRLASATLTASSRPRTVWPSSVSVAGEVVRGLALLWLLLPSLASKSAVVVVVAVVASGSVSRCLESRV